KRKPIDAVLSFAPMEIRFRFTHFRELRFREGAPDDVLVIQLLRPVQDRVHDGNFAHVLGHVGELIPAGDVSSGVNVPLRGPAMPVCFDSFPGCRNTGVFESQSFDVRFAAYCSQNCVALNCTTIGEYRNKFPRLPLQGNSPPAEAKRNTFARQRFLQGGRMLRLISWKNPFTLRNDGNRTSEPLKSLRHFDPNRACAEYQQSLRLAFKFEESLVCETAGVKIRNFRPAAASNDEVFGCEPLGSTRCVTDINRMSIQETRAANDHFHTQFLHVWRRIGVIVNAPAYLPHTLHNRAKRNIGCLCGDAKSICRSD